MQWKPFMAGAATVYALLTTVMMYAYVARHPTDNLLLATLEWPYRVFMVGYLSNQCGVC